MKKFFLWAMAGMALIGFTACEPNTPQEPEKQDTIPASFPKKHLIEEFTGQACGYCPDGMDAVHEFVGNDTNWVLVLHHAGYSDDHFTVKGSKTIATALNVKVRRAYRSTALPPTTVTEKALFFIRDTCQTLKSRNSKAKHMLLFG